MSEMSGNSGYPRHDGTAAAIVQKASELSSSATENFLRPVAILVK